jgi:hypothetical protein
LNKTVAIGLAVVAGEETPQPLVDTLIEEETH